MDAPNRTLPAQPIKLFRASISGHCHRVQLLLSILGLPYTVIDINLVAKEQKSANYLQMNPFGQVPVIQDGDVTLADSNAILVYLARRYGADRWYPQDPELAARVQAWLSVAAGLIAYGPAAARAIVLFGRAHNADEVIGRSHGVLAVMDSVLQKQDYLAGPWLTLADVSNYAYVARAPEGKVSLDAYAHVRAWLARIEALPGFVPMQPSIPVGDVR